PVDVGFDGDEIVQGKEDRGAHGDVALGDVVFFQGEDAAGVEGDGGAVKEGVADLCGKKDAVGEGAGKDVGQGDVGTVLKADVEVEVEGDGVEATAGGGPDVEV